MNNPLRRAVKILSLIALIGMLLVPQTAGKHSARAQSAPPEEGSRCVLLLESLTGAPNWRDQLRDPVINEREEIAERVEFYSQIRACIQSGALETSPHDADRQMAGTAALPPNLLELTGYFVILAGGALDPQPGPGQSFLLRFDNLQDPAVRILRDELKIPQPEGYLYIWMYPSRESLPPELKPVFANPNVQGVTILTRYVVVLDNVDGEGDLADFQYKVRSSIFSHEFVHAYVKSFLGPDKGTRLPRWYDEGLAIYLSGSSEPSSLVYYDENGRRVKLHYATRDYALYRDTFTFLEQAHGREAFMKLIRRSLLEETPALLYQDLEISSETELFARVKAEQTRRGLTRLGYVVGGISGTALLVFGLARVLRRRRDLEVELEPEPEFGLPEEDPSEAVEKQPADGQMSAASSISSNAAGDMKEP